MPLGSAYLMLTGSSLKIVILQFVFYVCMLCFCFSLKNSFPGWVCFFKNTYPLRHAFLWILNFKYIYLFPVPVKWPYFVNMTCSVSEHTVSVARLYLYVVNGPLQVPSSHTVSFLETSRYPLCRNLLKGTFLVDNTKFSASPLLLFSC